MNLPIPKGIQPLLLMMYYATDLKAPMNLNENPAALYKCYDLLSVFPRSWEIMEKHGN